MNQMEHPIFPTTEDTKPVYRLIWKYISALKEFDNRVDGIHDWLKFHHNWLYGDLHQHPETVALHTKLDNLVDIITSTYKESQSIVAMELALNNIEELDTLLPIMERTFDMIWE